MKGFIPSVVLSNRTRPGHEPVDLRSLGLKVMWEGADRGINASGDVLTQTVDGRPLNEVWNEFQAALQAFRDGRDPLISLLTFEVQEPIESVAQASQSEFEEASEFGVPKGIRGGNFFEMGYDFRWHDIAIRYTWQFLAEALATQVESLNAMVLEAENRLVFNKTFKAIFNNVTRSTDINQRSIAVYPLYNGDATVPPAYKTTTHTSGHDHYLVSGAASVDSGDLDEMATHLKHHGYGTADGARMLLLVNEQELNTIRTFRIASGDSYDFVASGAAPPILLPANQAVGGQAVPTQVDGFTVAGKYGPWLVVEEDYIPAGYMLGFSTGGTNNIGNPVGIREHRQSTLRGLQLVKGPDNDYPLIDSYYVRGFGTGVRHRGASVVMQVKASGTYDIPADYV